jgi:hypothetical protein
MQLSVCSSTGFALEKSLKRTANKIRWVARDGELPGYDIEDARLAGKEDRL